MQKENSGHSGGAGRSDRGLVRGPPPAAGGERQARLCHVLRRDHRLPCAQQPGGPGSGGDAAPHVQAERCAPADPGYTGFFWDGPSDNYVQRRTLAHPSGQWRGNAEREALLYGVYGKWMGLFHPEWGTTDERPAGDDALKGRKEYAGRKKRPPSWAVSLGSKGIFSIGRQNGEMQSVTAAVVSATGVAPPCCDGDHRWQSRHVPACQPVIR